MKRLSRSKAQRNIATADVVQESEPPGDQNVSPSQPSRRRVLGWMKAAGLGLVAMSGAGVLVKQSTQTAYAKPADTLGSFSSSDGSTPAVAVSGTNGSQGISVNTDSGSGIISSSSYGEGSANAITGITGTGYGVYGNSGNSFGVYGNSVTGWGVVGETNGGYYTSGLYGYGGGPGSFGLIAYGSYSGGTGVYAYGGSYAGTFVGSVEVYGTLSKGGGSFLIDHPLDPANKELYHSFVESPDMKNIYDGVAVLDQRGETVVSLPDWFGALNKDFRYQLTCLGSAAPVYISREIADNQFTIAGGRAGLRVSWQVTGIRRDRWAEKYRIPVEAEKPAGQRGRYHYPELYGQPESKGLHPQPTLPGPLRSPVR